VREYHVSRGSLQRPIEERLRSVSCQRRTRISGESPCLKDRNRPPGRKTWPIPRMASATPGIVHNGERADDRITRASGKGDSLHQADPGIPHPASLASLALGALYHSWIGFQRVKFLHFRWIVVWEISRPVRRRPPGPVALRLWKKAVGESFEWASDCRAPLTNVRIDSIANISSWKAAA